jgi:hypothetical protein
MCISIRGLVDHDQLQAVQLFRGDRVEQPREFVGALTERGDDDAEPWRHRRRTQ